MPQLSELPVFPTGHCSICEKVVLTWTMLDAESQEHRLCVNCDTPVGSGLDWIDADQLGDLGYTLDGPQTRRSGSGCGSGGGCGSCSR